MERQDYNQVMAEPAYSTFWWCCLLLLVL